MRKGSENFMEDSKWDGRQKKNIIIGGNVEIVEKKDQGTDNVTEGYVKKILTKSNNHPHGIKVELETGEVGRVKDILV